MAHNRLCEIHVWRSHWNGQCFPCTFVYVRHAFNRSCLEFRFKYDDVKSRALLIQDLLEFYLAIQCGKQL